LFGWFFRDLSYNNPSTHAPFWWWPGGTKRKLGRGQKKYKEIRNHECVNVPCARVQDRGDSHEEKERKKNKIRLLVRKIISWIFFFLFLFNHFVIPFSLIL
jgi:hypothetical protein